jgi:plastocyanin
MIRFALAVLLVAACGGDDGGGMVPIDAAKVIDAAPPANKVTTVTCPTTPAATVMTTNASNSYMPMATTVPVDGVVRFVNSSEHDVAPNPIAAMTDPGLVVGFGQTKCLKFTQPGTYGFMCSPHGFVGTVSAVVP